jgi:hypothetical protein
MKGKKKKLKQANQNKQNRKQIEASKTNSKLQKGANNTLRDIPYRRKKLFTGLHQAGGKELMPISLTR